MPDYGVLDELFALRDREDPEDFERGWDVKSMWAVMEFDAQQWARLDVQVLAPVLAMTRVVMDVAAVRPVLLLAAEGRSVHLVRETSLTSSASPSAVLDASLEVFKGRSSVLDGERTASAADSSDPSSQLGQSPTGSLSSASYASSSGRQGRRRSARCCAPLRRGRMRSASRQSSRDAAFVRSIALLVRNVSARPSPSRARQCAVNKDVPTAQQQEPLLRCLPPGASWPLMAPITCV